MAYVPAYVATWLERLVIGLLAFWSFGRKKRSGGLGGRRGNLGNAQKKRFFFSDVLPINYYDYKSTYGSTNSSVWTQETHCSEFKL